MTQKRFKRPCRRCGKLYQPTGKQAKYCENCKLKKGNPTK